ncbi:hypothetical protein ACKWWR_005780 [Pseudomonas aeruginosa]|uniref:hypothetical protein n=1 Tax=Pseudomonas aeruginosa TaxID=287 RepID=UPI000F5014A6|nr:hypothetical protein [Pseudomonas aeruginosa]EIU3602691.1 hypothetical protein [Pseudomonas aeruginosa]EIU3805583.1 hypothetical protein [Pseudomonas aeruginosa]EJD6678368.1 hypothetical protein [Pseudomonas aeruginosa]EKC1487342.1 hypothetical protein [Pseudomonas aeruginosa]EKT8087571.1 hypothetical protein [Pseudomonas aeruginosa]
MSSSGYQVGLSAGYAHSRATQASYEAAINEWRLHSENLKHQVKTLNERIEIMQGHFEANNYVLLLLLEELRKTSPNSPLLSKENRDSLRQKAFDRYLEDRGYEGPSSRARR